MVQSKKAKNAIFLGTLFGLIAVFFALMYHFNVIKTLDLALSVTYVSYFVGLTCFYLSSYCKEKNYNKARILSLLAGIVFICVAVALLIYGFVTGNISFFNL